MGPVRPILALRGVSRVYGQGTGATRSLRSVSLEVYQGEFVAVVGPSGAGKSTLLNILGLLDHPTDGSYLFNGFETSTLTERERDRTRNEQIGFVFQDSHMLLDDTAAGNTALALQVRGVPMAERRRLVGRALAELGVKSREAELTSTLSGGERQRVAVARAIAGNPALILADEPTGALDTANTQKIIDRLKALNAAGTTVVVITHDPMVAAAAHRRVEIIDGMINDDDSLPSRFPTRPGPTGFGKESSTRSGSEAHLAMSPRRTSHGLTYRAPRRFWQRVGGEALTAISSLSGNVGRTMLLLLAFALGSGGLVASVGVSQSAATQIADRLTAASLDEVIVRFRDTDAYVSGLYSPGSDYRAAIQLLPHVRGVGFVAALPKSTAAVRLLPRSIPGDTFDGTVLIADAGYLTSQGASTFPGHSGALLDSTWHGAVAVVGRDAATQLGITTVGPGSVLWVGERSVDVIGFIDAPGRDARLPAAVILSPAAAVGLSPDDPRLVVRTEPGYPAAVADAIPRAASPDHPSAVRVDTVADLRNLQKGVRDDLSVLVATVSVLLLVLAVLMSAVAMYMSVRTRAGQIALRRAVGASRSSISRLFLFEGLLVGSAGGVAGTALGLCAVVSFCLTQGWTPTLDPAVAVIGAGAGAVSGFLSALYPALVAARQDPAQAIRG